MTPAERREAIRKLVGDEAGDFEIADLQAIADGPIMDPNKLYLPAGRLSEQEWQERNRQQMRDAGLE